MGGPGRRRPGLRDPRRFSSVQRPAGRTPLAVRPAAVRQPGLCAPHGPAPRTRGPEVASPGDAHRAARAEGLAPAARQAHRAAARRTRRARQQRQRLDGDGPARHGDRAAGGLGRAGGDRTRRAGTGVPGLYRDLRPRRRAADARRIRIALPAGPRPRDAGGDPRSEERRGGEECRCRGSP
ncbi:hypothetical protein G6F35_016556 [Rhizopus arrhizus]|nr:hypothetical protein G6F35_016556 [Rhizopus arrhizus]